MVFCRPIVRVLLGLAGLSACGPIDFNEERSTVEPGKGADAQGSAVTSPSQRSKESPRTGSLFAPRASELERATAAVKSIDYIPFAYTQDGCWARSLYMGMESSVAGVELAAMFVFAPEIRRIQVGESTAAYHVAPILVVPQASDTARTIIFDPSIAKDPIEIDEWFTKMGYAPRGSHYLGLKFGPSPAYSVRNWMRPPIVELRESSRRYDYDEIPPLTAAHPTYKVPAVESAARYSMKDIQKSCMAMRMFIRSDSLAVDKVVKAERLVARTKELIGLLDGKNRIERDMSFSEERCASADQYDAIE